MDDCPVPVYGGTYWDFVIVTAIIMGTFLIVGLTVAFLDHRRKKLRGD